MKDKEAKRVAYDIVADLIEEYLDRNTERVDPTAIDVHTQLLALHDKFQLKANTARIIPAMRLDELEQLGVAAATSAPAEVPLEEVKERLRWLNLMYRSFTDILNQSWVATASETGGLPDEVELLDGRRLRRTGAGWMLVVRRCAR